MRKTKKKKWKEQPSSCWGVHKITYIVNFIDVLS